MSTSATAPEPTSPAPTAILSDSLSRLTLGECLARSDDSQCRIFELSLLLINATNILG